MDPPPSIHRDVNDKMMWFTTRKTSGESESGFRVLTVCLAGAGRSVAEAACVEPLGGVMQERHHLVVEKRGLRRRAVEAAVKVEAAREREREQEGQKG